MPDGNSRLESIVDGGDDQAFFSGEQESGRSENPSLGSVPGSNGEKSPGVAGSDGGFGQTPEAKKKRGRPAGSRNKANAEDGFRPKLAVEDVSTKESDAKRASQGIFETIKARHLMLAMIFGLPVPEDNKLQALALAWARFQQEYPKTQISRKVSVAIDLAAAGSATYLPMLMVATQKAKEAAANRKRPGFNIPPTNPGVAPNGVDPTATRRAAPGGEEIVLASGVAPDGGKISFE